MLGYNWPRVHGMIVALPVALLSMAVLFELAAVVFKKATLRQTGFALLLVGALGAAAAVGAGLMAEGKIDHGEAIHELMEEHEHLALYTLGIFVVVAVWRLARERRMGGGERTAALALSLVGLGFLANTGHHGGELVFEHAAGVPNSVLKSELINREAGHTHEPGEPEHRHHDEDDHDDPPVGQASPAADSEPDGGAPEHPTHPHPPGTPPHKD